MLRFLRHECRFAFVRRLSVVLLLLSLCGSLLLESSPFNRLLLRVQANNTAQALPFAQAWTNTGLITANDNWSGVPGIEGFLGQDLTTATGTDPQTILGISTVANDLDVIANQSNPNTLTAGGVAEFDGIANPTIALQGSGTADAPHIIINLNTTGQSNINVAYTLRDIDGSTDNAVQPVALQYRVGSSGNFTNVPAGFVADATTGPSLATLVTPVSAALPAAANNQALVQVRIITSNAAGSDEWVGIDDINITGSGAAQPTLSINDVMVIEGDSGTTVVSFIVSLSAPAGAGGVTFDIATQDGSATAGNNDYMPRVLTGQTIAAGTQTYTFDVVINGDMNPEPNEIFFVNVTNVTGALVGDGQGIGTIISDDLPLTPIHEIQGSGSASPLAGQSVATSGIVTLLRNNGFFIQTPGDGDNDPATSQGIFIFTSSAPTVAVGNAVTLSGTVSEFFTSTQITASASNITVNSSGNALPSAVTLTTTILNPAGALDQLERFEGMRLRADSLTTISPSDNFFDFYTVLTGVPRPLREPGIEISEPLPPGAPANVPRFDENPERLVVDSNGRLGSTGLVVTSNVTVTNIAGVLDFSFGQYRLIPEAPPTVSPNISAIPVPTPTAGEFTIGSFNIENFFNDANFNTQRDKAALAIRAVMRSPDIIGLQEIGDLTVLQSLATKINADAVAASEPNPMYEARLLEANGTANDIDIDVGLLVKTSRVNILSVVQEGLDATFTNPNNGQQETTFDRPPLVLRATINRGGATPLPVTVIVNHLRSLIDIEQDPGDGPRVRAKRKAGADFVANLLQSLQTNEPESNIVTVGDFNAYQFNDGYVDVIGAIKGMPAPADQVTLASSDVVNPDYFVLTEELPADERYSFIFEGNAQALDHVIVNTNLRARLTRYAVARNNADFPETFGNDATRPERASDHDMPVAYFRLGEVATAGQVVISEFRFRGPTPAGGATNGSLDEFIELYNNTDADITVSTSDNSAGWALAVDDGVARFVIPNGMVIPARGHYLAVNSAGYSLVNYGGTGNAAGDITYTADIDDSQGIALFRTANPSNFSINNRLDAVGFAPADMTNLYVEGAGLPTPVLSDAEHSFVRRLATGQPLDSGDNIADFVLVSPAAGSLGGAAILGGPGPENSSSPAQVNAQVKASFIDGQCPGNGSANSACRNVRDPNSPLATFGTLAIRRTFTNFTGRTLTRLRFRIVDITTLGNLSPGQADMRALSVMEVNATRENGMPVTLGGLTLEEPPAQPSGGGLNSSLRVGAVSLVTPLGPGESVNVQFLLGVEQQGRYRFFVNIEAR